MAVRNLLKIGSGGLQMMSTAELNYISYLVRQQYATTAGDPGWLSINANAGWASIGAYDDTFRSSGYASIVATYNNSTGALVSGGTDPVDPTTSATTYTFRQNQAAYTTNPTTTIRNAGPLTPYASNSDLAPLSRGGTTDVFDSVVDKIIDDVEAGGIGRFYIGTSVPANYTSTGYVSLDTRVTPGSTAAASTVSTYTLSVKTAETAPTAVRPVKWNGSGDIKEMSDTEIVNFFYPYFLQRIGDGNRLHYVFSTSTTGIDCGSVSETTYTGVTAITASARTTGPYTSTYTYSQDVANLQTTTYYLRIPANP